jgi:hypothetical protein
MKCEELFKIGAKVMVQFVTLVEESLFHSQNLARMKAKPLQTSLLIVVLIFISNMMFSQENPIPVRDESISKAPVRTEIHRFDLGVGLGIDYGGVLGIQAGFIPVKHLVVYGAAGYYMIGFGWQVGVKGMIISEEPKHAFRPFLKGSFGTNSVIVVDGNSDYDKIYTGFTVGIGAEIRFGKKKKNGFDLELNVPLRTGDFWVDYNRMKNDPSMEVTNEPIPIAFSIGFHHEF